MDIGDWVGAVQSGVATIAIIVGAIWGYYKFVRGRTFARRAEPAVAAELLSKGDEHAIRATVSLKNTGAVDIPLRLAVVYIYSLERRESGDVAETEVATTRMLVDHEKIEAAETIAEDALLPLPPANAETFAYLIKFVLFETRKKPGGIQWTARTIVPGALTAVVGSPGRRGGTMSDKDGEEWGGTYQRNADEEEIRRAERDVERQREASEDEIKRVESETEEMAEDTEEKA